MSCVLIGSVMIGVEEFRSLVVGMVGVVFIGQEGQRRGVVKDDVWPCVRERAIHVCVLAAWS